ncbi:MAG: hypothetical protein H7323_15735 [Frankiales bacterium]|nr:hypothetical protein [Frankiales bacterium]
MEPRPSAQGFEYRVRVQSRATVEQTEQYTYGKATARVELLDGLCVIGDGLGLKLKGDCVVVLLDPPLPLLPVGPPPGLGPLQIQVGLVE